MSKKSLFIVTGQHFRVVNIGRGFLDFFRFSQNKIFLQMKDRTSVMKEDSYYSCSLYL